ncbi:MAG: hypothetical protein KatS3mg043_1431 [Rhodothermaceae bacterium]|nr:MAG: hypothetical protein KatS3mg043_1431 [Rhodothermaceae bacterium]
MAFSVLSTEGYHFNMSGSAEELLSRNQGPIVKLLEAGHIPYRMVGSHRRVRRADVLDYRRARRARAGQAMQALADQAQDLGLGYEPDV